MNQRHLNFTKSRRLILVAAIASFLLTATLITCDLWVGSAATGRVYTSIDEIPQRDVALVLGTNPTVDSTRQNLYFRYRIDAAASLFAAGKVRHILVSGDNHTKGYDEPTAMRDALIAQGVPASAITLDYAGFRTLDSVIRAKEAFGLQNITIVSQPFHNARALFIANRRGVDAIAFAAKDPPFQDSAKTRARETLARCKAVLDLCIINTEPRFTGPREPIKLSASTASTLRD